MNLFELFIKISVDDDASDKISKLSEKMSNGLQTAAKVGVAAIGTAVTAMGALTKQSVESYAEFEQLVGGAELMFGSAFESVMQNAQDAYKTVQMSQNEYLQQVNGFATGLKTALGGNEQAAADLAHRIIQAEADIVAATGNSQEAVQNAFNGIMKSNFTMLDNLQIGITPTKEGFQEVIDKVNEWNKTNGEATEYQMGNLADMQSALVDYIEMVGMSGYAQEEASKTISGSIASMRAAWENLLVGIADSNADLDVLLDNFMDSIETVANNIAPVIAKALPRILEVGKDIIKNLLDGIASGEIDVADAAEWIVTFIIDTIVELFPLLIEAGISIIAQLLVGILQAIPRLLMIGPEILNTIIESLFSVGEKIAEEGENIVERIREGISRAWQGLVDWFNNLWDSLFNRREVDVRVNTYENNRGYRRYKNGLEYVPYDGYIAELHRGERVLTAKESKLYSSGSKGYGDIYINVEGANYSDPRELAEVIAEELQFLTDRKAAAYA